MVKEASKMSQFIQIQIDEFIQTHYIHENWAEHKLRTVDRGIDNPAQSPLLPD